MKVTYVDANKGHQDFLTSGVINGDSDTNNSDDVFADKHASSTDEEQATTSDMVNSPQSWNSHSNVYDIGCDRNRKGIWDACAFEECGAVVENKVDTMPPVSNDLT